MTATLEHHYNATLTATTREKYLDMCVNEALNDFDAQLRRVRLARRAGEPVVADLGEIVAAAGARLEALGEQ